MSPLRLTEEQEHLLRKLIDEFKKGNPRFSTNNADNEVTKDGSEREGNREDN